MEPLELPQVSEFSVSWTWPHTPLILALRRPRPDSGNQTSNPTTATGKLLTDLTPIPVKFIDQYRLIFKYKYIHILFDVVVLVLRQGLAV